MIYITGDTHGEQARFAPGSMPRESKWTDKDYLIICGDFQYIYRNTAGERRFLDELEKKPYTICFCDGNHENFPAIFSYPEEEWNGGRIHRIRRNIIHLIRGQVYTIDGKKIFVMGGAYSRDRYVRRENESWWNEELPVGPEYNEAAANLEKHNFCVDLIITHTAPTEIVRAMGYNPNEPTTDGQNDLELTGFLEWVAHKTEFQHWYFGHFHQEVTIWEKYTSVWFRTYKV